MDSKTNEVLEALLKELEEIDTQIKASEPVAPEETEETEEEIDEVEDTEEKGAAAIEMEEEEEDLDTTEEELEDTEEEPDEEKALEDEAEVKGTGASDEEPEMDDDEDDAVDAAGDAAEDAAEAAGATEEEEEIAEEEAEEEAAKSDESDEVKGGKRVVLTPEVIEEYKEALDAELLERRQELLNELAEINEKIAPEPEEDRTYEMRVKRLAELGYEEADIKALSEDPILCAVERKVLTNGEPCAFCRGGCAAEKGLPGLLDIEAIAADAFKGEVLDSGYAPNDDLFIVDLKTEDGRTVEAFYDGSGNAAGWVLLSQDLVEETSEKDALAGRKVISMHEAEEVALKAIDGAVLGVDASVFEGYDAWMVQLEALDGKSFDVYVGLDGTTLGYDEYDSTHYAADLTSEEIGEIKALEAELAMKRAFSAEKREELAKEGHALPDGSFPIVNAEDLKNAIQAYGRSKNQDIAKAHIMKRAVQLGKEDLIPDEWTGEGEDKSDDSRFLKDLLDFQEISVNLDSE